MASYYYIGDVCESPFEGTGEVTGGEAGWYQFTLPAEPGVLPITTDDPYSTITAVTTCDFGGYYENYAGIINYAYSNMAKPYFSSDESSVGGGTTDAYLGTTIILNVTDYSSPAVDGISISYSPFVYGCTDPNSSNYNTDANIDDGSCICGGVEAIMSMTDSYGDGWNGSTYVIVDDSGAEIASGGLLSGFDGAEELCIPGDGTYSVYVGTAPASSGSWQYEIGWTLSAAETGFIIATGAPHTPTPGDGIFDIPLPAYTFQLYRNGTLLDDQLVAFEYYDTDVSTGTEYCYTVSQTEGASSASGQSEPDCDDLYVPSTCATAIPIVLDAINEMKRVLMVEMSGFLMRLQ